MRKFSTVLLTLIVFTICGFIGYSTNYTQTVKANDSPKMPLVVFNTEPVVTGFNINLDLNTGKAVVRDTDRDIKINIQRKDSIITRWKTSIVEKTKYIRVRELPAMQMPKTVVSLPFTKPEKI
jgi:hypothetical protein